jgi:hypothetical protein
MPKRSNLFQEVVALLQVIHAEDARVVESEMLVDNQTGARREVDICIHVRAARQEVLISLECSSWKRVREVGWVEQQIAKHERLPTNKLILVSSSGFTPEAVNVARMHNVTVLTPKEITSSLGDEITDVLKTLWVKTIHVRPSGLRVVVEKTASLPEVMMDANSELIFFNGDGSEWGTTEKVVERVVRIMLDERRGELAAEPGVKTHGTFEIDRPKEDRERDFYLLFKGVEPPALRRVRNIEIEAEIEMEVVSMPMKTQEMGGHAYAFGSAKTTLYDILVVTTDLDQHAVDYSGKFAARIKSI